MVYKAIAILFAASLISAVIVDGLKSRIEKQQNEINEHRSRIKHLELRTGLHYTRYTSVGQFYLESEYASADNIRRINEMLRLIAKEAGYDIGHIKDEYVLNKIKK